MKNIVFENVETAVFDNFFHDCLTRGQLKSLKFVNFGMEKLTIKNLKLEELIMKNVTVNKVEPSAFILDGSSVIEMVDSNFSEVNKDFLVGKTDKVSKN